MNSLTMVPMQIQGKDLFLLAVIVFGLLGFCLVAYRIRHSRTDEIACRRVDKRLRRLSKADGARLYRDVTLALPGGTIRFDNLMIDRFGVVLIRSFGWGTSAYGRPREATWKLMDKRNCKTVENPLLRLGRATDPLLRLFDEAGLHNIPIQPLAVLADPFEKATLYLGCGEEAVGYDKLKEWYRRRCERSVGPFEAEQLIRTIESAIRPTPPAENTAQ